MEYLDIDGFCDLNITYQPDDKLLNRILEFDYRAIALNHTVDMSKTCRKPAAKKRKGKTMDSSDLMVFPNDLARSFRSLIAFSSPDIKKYDLIAVLPTTNAAYQTGVTDYRPSGKMHKQLVDRSGYFEISYSQALKSSAKRQETFTMAQYFFIYGKSKNAIISSGASHYLDVRNPFDVANLGVLFGLSEEKAKCAVSRNCRLLLLAAAGRKYGKTAITVELVADEEEPNQKRIKLNTNDNISEVTCSISSLKTTEEK